MSDRDFDAAVDEMWNSLSSGLSNLSSYVYAVGTHYPERLRQGMQWGVFADTLLELTDSVTVFLENFEDELLSEKKD